MPASTIHPIKIFFFYGNKIITGYSGAAGASEVDELMDMIFSQEEAASYLPEDLQIIYIYYKIDNDIRQTIIRPLAQVFQNNNFNIQPVLSALFKAGISDDMISTGPVSSEPAGFCHRSP